MNKEQKKPQEDCYCHCHCGKGDCFGHHIDDRAHCQHCQEPQKDIFDEFDKKFTWLAGDVDRDEVSDIRSDIKDWIKANFISRKALRKMLEEKKRVMAHIVGTKRVETPYVTIDDIITELKI